MLLRKRHDGIERIVLPDIGAGADLEVRTEEDNTEQLNNTISEAGLTKAELNRN